MQLFFAPDLDKNSKIYDFSKDESKHIARVLRKKEGDILYITNGKGYLFEGKLTNIDQKKCSVELISSRLQPKKRYRLHMAVAPTKMNERYEWFLEKSTEIGIDEITPLICDHSERKKIKNDRFERIIQTALKQSLNCYLPQLNEAIGFRDFIDKKQKAQLFIAHCKEDERYDLKRHIMPDKEVLILIGPEGDFSDEEIQLAIQAGYYPVSLSDNRLRTETAAIVACHIVSMINN
ncbi:16S rRNA (uracil(1498)-N(3))-methyltransferase [Robertkochia aurantiaca]|uniref:16S rRNA (uracil(1498)-N(3))-methyltransferase n=1 Tax=Robertkochia aurantiaca TaxID=2873700 RepID=UPI001CD02852|nr:16S rRNA (uracil(1498)-N(3))-methyltransferase [Robertkochia sp. 3YJGBD-33]